MIATADQERAGSTLLLEMTFQAKGLVALGQQPLVNRAVRLMAGVATLAQGLVLEDKRPALHGVALETGFVCARQFGAAALDCGTFVRLVAIGTTHLAFQHRMVVRERELRTDIEVALEAGLRERFGLIMEPRPPPASTCLLPGP